MKVYITLGQKRAVYDVSWQHSTRKTMTYYMGKEVVLNGETWCFIKLKGRSISQGHALCKAPDQYRKDAGRKSSLTHALAASRKHFTREIRTKFWKKFFKTTVYFGEKGVKK